jgi:hypothetical protein
VSDILSIWIVIQFVDRLVAWWSLTTIQEGRLLTNKQCIPVFFKFWWNELKCLDKSARFHLLGRILLYTVNTVWLSYIDSLWLQNSKGPSIFKVTGSFIITFPPSIQRNVVVQSGHTCNMRYRPSLKSTRSSWEVNYFLLINVELRDN